MNSNDIDYWVKKYGISKMTGEVSTMMTGVGLSCWRVNLELVSVVAKLELEVVIMLLFTVDVKIV